MAGHQSVSETLATNETLVIRPSLLSSTGGLEVHTISHGDSSTVTLTHGDQSVQLDSFSGAGISTGNQIQLLGQGGMTLVIENTGASAADYIVTGQEIDQ